MQLFGASQNTLQVVPPPWNPPKPRPQTEHPDLTVHFGSCSNAGCGMPGPTLFTGPSLSTFPSLVLAAMKGNESLPWDAVGAAEKLHSFHPVFDILRCHCLATQLVAKCCQGCSQRLSLPFTAHVTPIECCFQYAQKPVRHVQSFYEMPSDCSLPAVV